MNADQLKKGLDVAGSRIAKLIVGFALTYAAVKWKLSIPAPYEWMRGVFEEVIQQAFVACVFGLLVHFGIAMKRNPRDVVSPTEAAEGREAKADRKVERNLEERERKAGLRDELPPKIRDFERRTLEEPPHNQD